MKKSVFIIILFAIFGIVHSQTLNESLISALQTGNEKKLSVFLNNSVDITIKSEESVYSKTQAELILKDFFIKNSPQSFSIIHKGTSGKDAAFFIGNLQTKKGIFRTYIYLKKLNDAMLIQELKFEEENSKF